MPWNLYSFILLYWPCDLLFLKRNLYYAIICFTLYLFYLYLSCTFITHYLSTKNITWARKTSIVLFLWSLMGCPMIQQKCNEKTILWLLFPTARKSLAWKCSEDPSCPPKFIWYAGLWRRSRPYSFLCSSCTFLQLLFSISFFFVFCS